MSMAETGEGQAVVPHNLGDLMNVASTAPTANLSLLVWRVSTSDWGPLAPHAQIADIATADGSDAGTTQTLANATKAKVNAILAALRTNGIVLP